MKVNSGLVMYINLKKMHQLEQFDIFNPIHITRTKRLSVQKWNIQALHKMGKVPSGTRQNMAAVKLKVAQSVYILE